MYQYPISVSELYQYSISVSDWGNWKGNLVASPDKPGWNYYTVNKNGGNTACNEINSFVLGGCCTYFCENAFFKLNLQNDIIRSCSYVNVKEPIHCNGIMMSMMASQITSLKIVYSTVYSGTDERKTSKLHVSGLCAGYSLVTSEFPAERVSKTENASIWWCHHVMIKSGNVLVSFHF